MRFIGLVLVFALAHLIVAMIVGAIAFGLDFDQLSSRTLLSRGARVVHDVLWFPHDTVMRALPIDWKISNARIVTPAAILLNSLLWGAVLASSWRVWRRRRLS
jgi:hypothetical protein